MRVPRLGLSGVLVALCMTLLAWAVPGESPPDHARTRSEAVPFPGNEAVKDAPANRQIPPGGIWYYQVTGYSSICEAEGPF